MSGKKHNIFKKKFRKYRIEHRLIEIQEIKLQLNAAENEISALQEENYLLKAEVQALRSLLNKK